MRNEQQVYEALKALYEETARSILVNNLGDIHEHHSMQMARDALKAAEGQLPVRPIIVVWGTLSVILMLIGIAVTIKTWC